MENHLNKSILVAETCIIDCLKCKNHSMNPCIQNCLVFERVCKALKVCHKNNCRKDLLKSLIKSCLLSGVEVVNECGKHKMKCCKDCVKVIGSLNKLLKAKHSKKKSKSR